jgi:hypothetical protein
VEQVVAVMETQVVLEEQEQLIQVEVVELDQIQQVQELADQV